MKKSLIAVAVAGLFAAPVAMADVTISGAINLGVQAGKSGTDSAGNSGLSTNQLFPSYSNFNLSSTDDIGNGNKVIFNYQFDISGTSSAHPGLAGDAVVDRGEVAVGERDDISREFHHIEGAKPCVLERRRTAARAVAHHQRRAAGARVQQRGEGQAVLRRHLSLRAVVALELPVGQHRQRGLA